MNRILFVDYQMFILLFVDVLLGKFPINHIIEY